MFIDSSSVSLRAGKGGNGVVAWRREKFIPKGGPAGGDGGKGGSIILEVSPHLLSLEGFRNKKIICAQNGRDGSSGNKKGKNGEDLVLSVPPGTLIKDAKTKEVLFDLTEVGSKIVLCKGGNGGKGNCRFKSPTNQAPNQCTEGVFGEIKEIEFELKLIADIGLIGFPNSGKSTLISTLANISVKIAPYPFTTLRPNIGLIQFDDYSKVFIADIPGIIQGAHLNKGLGYSFLKHIERTNTLVYVIDLSGIDGRDPIEDFLVLQDEMKKYSPELLKKPFLVALNKIDTPEAKDNLKQFKKKFSFDKSLLFEISALTKENLDIFLSALRSLAQKDKKKF
jgi:GTPase